MLYVENMYDMPYVENMQKPRYFFLSININSGRIYIWWGGLDEPGQMWDKDRRKVFTA